MIYLLVRADGTIGPSGMADEANARSTCSHLLTKLSGFTAYLGDGPCSTINNRLFKLDMTSHTLVPITGTDTPPTDAVFAPA